MSQTAADQPTDHIHISHKRGTSKHDRHRTQHGHNINSALIADRRRMVAGVQSALLKVHSRSGGRRRLPIERHTQGHTECAFQPSTWEGRSRRGRCRRERTSLFILSLRICDRYVCNMPVVLVCSLLGAEMERGCAYTGLHAFSRLRYTTHLLTENTVFPQCGLQRQVLWVLFVVRYYILVPTCTVVALAWMRVVTTAAESVDASRQANEWTCALAHASSMTSSTRCPAAASRSAARIARSLRPPRSSGAPVSWRWV